jgi:hypothetical protein
VVNLELLDLMFKKVSIKEMGLDGRARHELQEMVKGVLEELGGGCEEGEGLYA